MRDDDGVRKFLELVIAASLVGMCISAIGLIVDRWKQPNNPSTLEIRITADKNTANATDYEVYLDGEKLEDFPSEADCGGSYTVDFDAAGKKILIKTK